MKWFLPLLIVGWLLAEIGVFIVNPFHAPASQLPLRLFGLQYFKVEDDTMAPTVAAGRYVLITAWPYLHHGPATADIVAFSAPGQSDTLLFRRVVAAGVSTIETKAGVTYVDGKAQVESWLKGLELKSDRSLTMRLRHVSADHYFLMGDNRDVSEDSREWGAIERGAILGRQW